MKIQQISLALALAIAPSAVDAGYSWSSYSWNPPSTPSNPPPPAPRAPVTPSPTEAPTASPTSAPTASPTSAPTASPTSAPTQEPAAGAAANNKRELDCSLALADPIQLEDNLVMRQVINQDDNSVTVEMTLQKEAWIGFAFSPSGQMVPNTAVIGLPDDGQVGLYSLTSRSAAGVTLLPEAEQDGLSDVSVVQQDGETVLSFTLSGVGADGEALATGGQASRIIYAHGFGNTLGFHEFRSSAEVVFDNCLEILTPSPPPPAPAPVQSPPSSGELDCSLALSDPIQLDDKLTMLQIVNQQDDSVTIQLILQDEAWIGFAFSPNGQMIGSTSVIGIPDDGVGLYQLDARILAGINLLPPEEQERLSNVSIVQGAGSTVLTFTLAVGSDGQPLAVGGEASRIIFAYGSGNQLAYHPVRASAEVVFTNCAQI